MTKMTLRDHPWPFLLAVALAMAPALLSAQCTSTVVGTNGNPIPLTIGAEANCVANSLAVPATTTNHQSAVTPLGCGATNNRDIWFTFTATSTETVINLYNANQANVGFMVYDGPCGTTMNLVGCAGFGQPAAYTVIRRGIPTVPGTTYYVRVARTSNNSLPGGLRICGWDRVRPDEHPVCEASFESGTTAGWTCRYGHYGAPVPFSMQFPNTGCLNPRGMDAPLSTGDGGATAWNAGDRHTIISDKHYFETRSLGNVSGVAPGGGNYSFRLGDNDNGGGTANCGSTCPSKANSVSFDLLVTRQNAGFTYMFSTLMENPAHAPEEQPRFEALVTDVDGNALNCGYFLFVANSGQVLFRNGPGNWQYTDWTEVGLDLTPFIGQTVRIEFRVANCYPAQGGGGCTCINNVCTTTFSSGGVTYTCTNVSSCTPPNPASNPNCTTGSGTNNNAGTHIAYAYVDAYCKPLEVETPEFCAGETQIEICAPPGYRNYVWPAQTGLRPPLNQRCVTVDNPIPGTVYTVYMELVNGCPTMTTVELLGIPVTTTNDTTICGGQGVDLTARVDDPVDPPYTFVWSHGPTGPGPHRVTPTQTTTYTVTTTNNSGCSSVRSVTITVDDCPPTVVVNSDTVCPGGCTDLLAVVSYTGTGNVTVQWSPSLPGTVGPHRVCPTQSTDYIVTVTDPFGNSASDTARITVRNQDIPVTLTRDTTICQGMDVDLVATVDDPTDPPYTFQWNPGGFTGPGPHRVNPSSTTTYTVTTTNALGCFSDRSMTVTAIACPPTVTLVGGTICSGECVDLTANVTYPGAGTVTVQWDPNIGGTAGPVRVCPESTTTYRVTVTDPFGNSATATATVTVHPKPVARFTTEPPSPQRMNTTVTFTDRSTPPPVTTRYWTFGTGDSSTDSIPVITYTVPGSYLVTLRVTNGLGCPDSTSIIYVIKPDPIRIPNVFSPNGDGPNDRFHILNLEYYRNHLTIYSRWGNVVYETDNYRNTWSAPDVSDGTYYYVLHLTDEGESYAGHVTILR